MIIMTSIDFKNFPKLFLLTFDILISYLLSGLSMALVNRNLHSLVENHHAHLIYSLLMNQLLQSSNLWLIRLTPSILL